MIACRAGLWYVTTGLAGDSAMIVCVCNKLCEKRCREAAERPECRSVCGIYQHYGCRVRCGKCVPFMHDLFQSAKDAPLPEAAAKP